MCTKPSCVDEQRCSKPIPVFKADTWALPAESQVNDSCSHNLFSVARLHDYRSYSKSWLTVFYQYCHFANFLMAKSWTLWLLTTVILLRVYNALPCIGCSICTLISRHKHDNQLLISIKLLVVGEQFIPSLIIFCWEFEWVHVIRYIWQRWWHPSHKGVPSNKSEVKPLHVFYLPTWCVIVHVCWERNVITSHACLHIHGRSIGTTSVSR